MSKIVVSESFGPRISSVRIIDDVNPKPSTFWPAVFGVITLFVSAALVYITVFGVSELLR